MRLMSASIIPTTQNGRREGSVQMGGQSEGNSDGYDAHACVPVNAA
jgi:hypothetical protein